MPLRKNIEHICYKVLSKWLFRNKITITTTDPIQKVFHIQLFCFVPKREKKKRRKLGILWHLLHIFEKSHIFKTGESFFSLVWLMK